jgi:type I restriction enzyme S subunit
MTSLGEVVVERRETPSDLELMSGATPIIAKIGFNDGRIELRDGGQTRTKMIRIQPGDLVVSGINAAKGAVAIYGSDQPGPIAATIHYSSYAPIQDAVDVRFLWWLFRSGFFRQVLSDQVPGGIKTELKPNRLLPITIPLPPLAEQQRIVARIDALASRIEEAKKLRVQAAEEAEAVMGAIITGTQVNTPGGYLIDVLLDKPRNGWSVVCDNDPQGIAVLTLSAVTGFVFRKNEFKTTSASTDPAAHYWLCPGDIVITRSNTPELVGHAAIYQGEPSPCIYPDLMMRLQVNERRADRRFLWYWLRGPLVREFIRRKAKGTSPTMKKISQKIVMGIPFPTQLSIDRQQRIVVQLDNLQAKVDAVKRLQAETQAELDALLPSVLDRAFRGEL